VYCFHCWLNWCNVKRVVQSSLNPWCWWCNHFWRSPQLSTTTHMIAITTTFMTTTTKYAICGFCRSQWCNVKCICRPSCHWHHFRWLPRLPVGADAAAPQHRCNSPAKTPTLSLLPRTGDGLSPIHSHRYHSRCNGHKFTIATRSQEVQARPDRFSNARSVICVAICQRLTTANAPSPILPVVVGRLFIWWGNRTMVGSQKKMNKKLIRSHCYSNSLGFEIHFVVNIFC